MKQAIRINFKDFWFYDTIENIYKSGMYQLLSKRYNLEIVNSPDFLIYSDSEERDFLKYNNCVKIFYTGENNRPNFDECDYSFSFDPTTNMNYRLPLYKLRKSFDELKDKHILDENTTKYTNRKFCNFIYSNCHAKERIEFMNQLSKYKSVDSGGTTINNIGFFVKNKLEWLKEYKFTIAFENVSYPGYTTEKILHPLATKSIPIYWGNPLVYKDFNPKAFINCNDYNNFDEVIKRVIELDNDDDQYLAMLREPAFVNDIENEYVNEDNIFKRFDKIFNIINKDNTNQ